MPRHKEPEVNMIRTIAWYIHFVFSLILKIPQMLVVEKMLKQNKKEEAEAYIHRVTSKWALSHVRMSGARVKIYGEEALPPDLPVLFVSNHQGNFDIALFMSYIDKPKGYISKIEMARLPVIRSWMVYMHCVFMERGNLRKAAESIHQGIKNLKEGYSMVLFPEGTRSKSNCMNDFKAGAFKLATKSKAPIVPVTIKGSYKLMEANGNRICPAEVEIYIHPMVPTAELTKEEEGELPARIREIIQSKL
jgi:1-acyl-sn-glycerol-3-phosphate acyltransferase